MKDGKPVSEAFGEARGSLRRSEQYYVGSFTKKKDAIAALADYASDFHRPDSLDREFENVTEGGIPIVFIRRVNSGIVACAGNSRMSWSHSGVVEMFSGEPEKQKLYNLVKKSGFKSRFP